MLTRAIQFKIALPFVILLLVATAAVSLIYAERNKPSDQPTSVSLNLAGLFSNSSSSSSTVEFGSYPALANPDFFASTLDQLIESQADFIEADLTNMQLKVYEQGKATLTVPILTKGREGSWWETPAGFYRIETKVKNHFSSFGQVYQPWSMAFQGNFFIHGWPYYPDGTPVSSAFSGGCIRLSTPDAKRVYDLVSTGTPLLVREDGFTPDKFIYGERQVNISAPNYLAADLKSGTVFAAASPGVAVPIASITKIMTALIATEYIDLDREISVPRSALVFTSLPRLKAGEKHRAYSLLFPLLLESSNEAAETLAAGLGRERFIKLMNQKALALGMNSTKFADPSGIDPGNLSSAEDLVALARYLLQNRSFILSLTTGTLKTNAYDAPPFRDLKNFNEFEKDADFLGGKVGQTIEAKQTILSVFKLQHGGEERQFVIIVLGSSDRAADARTLLNYVRAKYAD